MQKNLTPVLNTVFAIAIVILYYLHFNNDHSAVNEVEVPVEMTNNEAKGHHFAPVYYVNTDTISEKYGYAKELDKKLKEIRKKSENRLEREVKKFEKEVIEFQEKARFMTQEEGQRRQEELVMKEQELARLEKQLAEQLMNDQEKLNKDLRNRILSYIREMKGKHNFSYVLGYSELENNILVPDDSLDLTEEILSGLNKAYEAE